MLEWIGAIEADAGDKWIGDQCEDVFDLAVAIVVRDSLHRWRAGCDHEVVVTRGDLTGDRNARRHVSLRVEMRDADPIPIPEPSLRQTIEGSADPFIEDRGV